MTAQQGTREWYMEQFHDAKRTIGEVWEALPDDLISSYEDPAEAVKDVLELRDQQIANLTARLAEAKAHADDLDRAIVPLQAQVLSRTEEIAEMKRHEFALGRQWVLTRIAAAIEESVDHETFMRGVVATLNTDPIWHNRCPAR